MCGIFGILAKEGFICDSSSLPGAFRRLAVLSESRGVDSSGVCFRIENEKKLLVLKSDIRISALMKRPQFASCINKSLSVSSSVLSNTFCVIGHARLVTNGTQLNPNNNQPVVKDGIVGIHNGIIVNSNRLFDETPGIKRKFEIDTEVLLSLVRMYLSQGMDLKSSTVKSMQRISGTVSAAMLLEDRNELILATNNGALYLLTGPDFLCFASERYILEQMEKQEPFRCKFANTNRLEQLAPDTGCCIPLDSLSARFFSIDPPQEETSETLQSEGHVYKIETQALGGENKRPMLIDSDFSFAPSVYSRLEKSLQYPEERLAALKRCTRCILPETFPYITFDTQGVCNYCRNYEVKNTIRSLERLYDLVEPYRNTRGRPDVLIPLSGGRDSTYTLHIVKKSLGLNPIAYTYDWGMVTDLARRNIARVCGRLKVENIIVAADIQRKRENIRKNIRAWLNNPYLGMVPLFMAGDKFFFYYSNRIKKQNGIRLNIWGVNHFENTDFKTGFAGLSPQFRKRNIYSLSLKRQVELFGFVAGQIMKTPSYINRSVFDSLGSFASRYIVSKRDYFNMFDYYRWDEKEIETLVKEEYDWETADDTVSTWRIGDGTAPFYNYIYTTVAGFCENDTFRSNQIREGVLTREEALQCVVKENRPRLSSIKWYLDIVGLDFQSTIDRINNIPKLYS